MSLLGGYGGHVTSDSHAPWNRIGKTHQKCHYHYLREILRTLTMKNPGPEFKKFAKALKGIIIDSWYPDKGLDPDDDGATRNLKVRNLLARVRRLISGSYTDPHCKRFVKRLRREITHLFPFIRLNTKCHNNDAERPLRPSVASRKVSGGSKSLAGAYNHAVPGHRPRDVQEARSQPARLFGRLYARPRRKKFRQEQQRRRQPHKSCKIHPLTAPRRPVAPAAWHNLA